MYTFFGVTLHSMRDLGSLTRVQACTQHSRIMEPEPLDHQGTPQINIFMYLFQSDLEKYN